MEPTPLDFSQIDEQRLIARGKYATVNFELRQSKQQLQVHVQDTCDILRLILNEHGEQRMGDLLASKDYLKNIFELSKRIDTLTEQKDQLYESAWGSPVEDTGELLGESDPL